MNSKLSDALPRFVGVLHLPPLPGGPRPSPGLQACVKSAVEDAKALVNGGAEAAILENFGDAPFTAGRVEACTVAYMTHVALAVRDACPTLTLGINVLRNDGRSALAIASGGGRQLHSSRPESRWKDSRRNCRKDFEATEVLRRRRAASLA